MDETKTVIAYVQLGPNKSNTLIEFAIAAKARFSKAELVLLTDHPTKWKNFPGKVLSVDIESLFSRINSKADPVKHLRMGGYWLHTLNRLFVLRELANYFPLDSQVIHFESDVIPLLGQEAIETFMANHSGVGVPRYSFDSGIASILIATSIQELNFVLKQLLDLARESDDELNDMNLLGQGLNIGIIKDLNEISSGVNIGVNSKSFRVYFDGASVGQFFFGVDERKRKWTSKSGYINPDSDIALMECKWQIISTNWYPGFAITMEIQDTNYIVANMHIHSKFKVPNSPDTREYWGELIADLNSGRERHFSIRNRKDLSRLRIGEAYKRARMVRRHD